MDGVYDLGGMQGFGEIEREADEPVFHEPWQATAFAVMFASQAMIRNNNADEYRHAVERMAPHHYFQAHYYERMLTGAVTLLVEKGVLTLEDLEQRAGGRFPLSQPVANQPLAELPAQPRARFNPGDRVLVKPVYPSGHIRAPRFCRGKRGVVLNVAPAFNFPDTAAHGGERRKEHTYHVEFAAQELWDDPGLENNSVVVDLWDAYLEPSA